MGEKGNQRSQKVPEIQFLTHGFDPGPVTLRDADDDVADMPCVRFSSDSFSRVTILLWYRCYFVRDYFVIADP